MTEYRNQESLKYEKILGRITNVAQLEKFVAAIEVTESQLRDDLDNFIDTRRHAQESKKLELARTELSTALSKSNNLKELLANAGKLASKITARVRLLDAERSRVRETAEYVKQVKELRSTILATNSALEKRDWNNAAESISKIRSLPIEGEFINTVVPSTDVPENPSVIVDKWIKQLTDLFSKEFNKAAEAKDVEKLTKFFSLFPLIGKDSIGLDCYSKFICNIIASQSRLIITNQSQQDVIGFYPAALMKLLEIVSTILNQHSGIISKYYGISHMTDIIERVERETDSQAGLISDTFFDKRNVSKVVNDVQGYRFPYLSSATQPTSARNSPPPRRSFEGASSRPSEDSISVIEVGDLISEFASMLNYWSMYCRFIAVKWNEYQDIKEEELKLPQPILDSKFSKKILTKFLPSFEIVVTFYIRRSLEQALQMEEIPSIDQLLNSKKSVPPETTPVSSIVEDFMFVISNSLKQVIETGQPVTLKNIIAYTRKIFDNDYILTLHKRLKDFYPRSGTILTATNTQQQLQQLQQQPKNSTMGSIFLRGANALNQIASGDETKLHTYIILLNSLQLGIFYFGKVIDTNIVTLPNFYQFGSDATKLEQIFNSLKDYFTQKSQEILTENINILFNQVLKNRLKVLLTDCFKDTDYLISSYEEEESIVTQKFILQWNQLMVSFYKVLHPKIYDELILTIVTTLSTLLERKLWTLENNVNELGSIKLERDYSGIIGEITRSRYNLRDKFLRVTQIIMILGFDDEDDEIDMHWVLTPSERQRARTLRIDRKK